MQTLKKKKNIFGFKKPFNYLFSRLGKSKESLEFESIVLPQETAEAKEILFQKIDFEKRRRNQAYRMLDYELSLLSYFDFFSEDAFLIAKQSKYFAYFFEEEEVNSLVFLFSFFSLDSEFQNMLKDYGITKDRIIFSIYRTYELQKEKLRQKKWGKFCQSKNIFEILKEAFRKKNWDIVDVYLEKNYKNLRKVSTFLKNQYYQKKEIFEELEVLLGVEKEFCLHEKIAFNDEVKKLFEKAAENAILRFKTPVITTEILFLTVMESVNSPVGKIIQGIMEESIDWYILRYQLMKRIHFGESHIRQDVKKNQQFFAYLLKTQLNESEFQLLIKKDTLQEATLTFRTSLIKQIIKTNFTETLTNEINSSIKATSSRKYLTF